MDTSRSQERYEDIIPREKIPERARDIKVSIKISIRNIIYIDREE